MASPSKQSAKAICSTAGNLDTLLLESRLQLSGLCKRPTDVSGHLLYPTICNFLDRCGPAAQLVCLAAAQMI